jgi:lipopolysaccharide export system permease protein
VVIILPIGIAIDIAEKIDKFLNNTDLTFWIILKDYYQHFVITYSNMFLPLAIFLAVVLFTSKLAANTEIIAMHSAQISFNRLLYPYILGALLFTSYSLVMNHFFVPKSNYLFTKFDREFIYKKRDDKFLKDISMQLGPQDYFYIRTFTVDQNRGSDIVYEHYEGTELKYRLKANSLKWKEEDSIYTLSNYTKRHIMHNRDILESGVKMDTTFNFYPKDLYYIDYLAKEMNSPELYDYIKVSEARGVKNLNPYKVELHKRTSLPFSTFILTLLAVSLSHKKKRGGTGLNIALGIGLAFVYIFFMKITEVLGAVAGAPTFFMVWLPNILFGIMAFLVYRHAARQ